MLGARRFPRRRALRFTARNSSTALGVFYQVVEAGFDRKLPKKAITHGLEVYRELVDEKGNPVDHGRSANRSRCS